jgi:hypothetical protein
VREDAEGEVEEAAVLRLCCVRCCWGEREAASESSDEPPEERGGGGTSLISHTQARTTASKGIMRRCGKWIKMFRSALTTMYSTVRRAKANRAVLFPRSSAASVCARSSWMRAIMAQPNPMSHRRRAGTDAA